MFIGHYGVALGLKKADKAISLGLLFLAVQAVDILWPIFVLLGVEKVAIVPGITAANPLDFVYYPFTHSLLAAFFWSAVVWFLCRWLPMTPGSHPRRAAWILSAAVFSHFVLDFIVHRPDLPLFPGGGSIKIGLGLWNHLGAAYLLEGVIFVGGLWIYLKSTKGTTFAGKYGMVILALFLLVANFINFFGSPPPSGTAVAASALIFNPLIAWLVFWLDKKRT